MSVDPRTVAQVFAAAKGSFRYCSDLDAYRTSEHWCTPDEIRSQIEADGFVLGDCDDFASLCVMLSRKIGLPARFVLCLTEAGEAHLVCEVEGWIMDNRQDSARPRDDLRYVWLAISGYVKGDPWRSLIIGNG